MPLPANGTVWPPVELKTIRPAMDAWSAWYTGTSEALEAIYATYGNQLPAHLRPVQYAGGVVGTVARWFWGSPPSLNGQAKHKLHIPVAADICQASADLLFAESPVLTIGDPVKGDEDAPSTPNSTQARLDELVDEGALEALSEAAELGAALGGSFVRVTWDMTVDPDRPFLTAVHADAALPEFRWGRLVAVTFWRTLKSEGQEVWRHLERHELDAAGNGVILHGLYRGSTTDLGMAMALTDNPATASLQLDENGVISTLSPGLAVEYFPNARPQRRWRKDPLGTDLGRSDLDGLEPLMDSLDEAWTALMRDVRLGKARVFVSQELLADQGPGQGASFDADQEIYSPLSGGVGSYNTNATTGAVKSLIDHFQPDIRAEEHLKVIDAIVKEIVSRAGYSGATFGERDSGQSQTKTATEVSAEQQRSFSTRDRKIRLITPRLQRIIEKLLAVDVAVFGTTGVEPGRPDVEFPDGVQESQLVLAQTAQAMFASDSASTAERVRVMHPDWDPDQVKAEVDLIKEEQSAAMPPMLDPAAGFAPDQGEDSSGVDATG